MVAFYKDCITHPEIIGFTYAFLSEYCYIILLASVSAMGGIRCGEQFFMVRPNRIVAGGTPVVQCGVVRLSSRNLNYSCFQLRPLFRAVLMDFFTIFTNPSARAGYDTRSIFLKRSLTGLNSEFSFS